MSEMQKVPKTPQKKIIFHKSINYSSFEGVLRRFLYKD